MLVLEGKCPKCFGNLVLSEEEYKITCEDCGGAQKVDREIAIAILWQFFQVTVGTKVPLKDLWRALKVKSVEYGPVKERKILTQAGLIIVKSYEDADVVRGEEVLDVVHASRGLVEDKDKLQELREGGFIM